MTIHVDSPYLGECRTATGVYFLAYMQNPEHTLLRIEDTQTQPVIFASFDFSLLKENPVEPTGKLAPFPVIVYKDKQLKTYVGALTNFHRLYWSDILIGTIRRTHGGNWKALDNDGQGIALAWVSKLTENMILGQPIVAAVALHLASQAS